MKGFLIALLLLAQIPAPPQLRTGIVSGILRTDKGVPLEGVRVAVTPAGGGVDVSVLESIGQTDKDGRYRLENVSPGNYHVVIGRAAGMQYHPGLPGPEGATTIAVTAGSTIAVPDLVLIRYRVSGRVIDAATGMGRRIENLVVCCEYALSETSSAGLVVNGTIATSAASVNEDGTFVFQSLPPGDFTVQAIDSSIITSGQPLVVRNTDVTDVVVKVSSGVVVEGQVVDRVGIPVVGVTSRLRSRTAAAGPGVVATLLGAGSGTGTLVIRTGSSTVTSISIASLNTVIASGLAPLPFVPPVPQPVQVGLDGRFAMNRVLPGVYTLEINAPGGNFIEREIEVGPFGLANLRAEMPFMQFFGRVVAADGGVPPKVTSVRLISSGAAGRIFYSYPDDAGRFSMLLAAGQYRVSTDGQGHSVRSVSSGSTSLPNQEFVFDGINKPEIVITVE